MCGINGFNFTGKGVAQAMNRVIAYRGPDQDGIWNDDQMTLGHVRLSIVDLSENGCQPMIYEHRGRKVVIVFNGEIYNFQELRDELIQKGYKFNSTSDTEVICASFLEKGSDCVKDFNGMWAFCLYDIENQKLFCSRDITGKKPFFYYHHQGKFIFSSELKGIIKHNIDLEISQEGLELYQSLGFIPAPYSIYQNVYKIEPRHNLFFDLKTKEITTEEYYPIPKFEPIYDKQKLIEEGRALLKDAVRLRMIADVPVGAFLSGGLDSSTVVALMKQIRAEGSSKEKEKNIHTFSIGFRDPKLDESKYINLIKEKLGTIHHHEYFEMSDFDRLMPMVQTHFDEPFADYAFFPNFKVAELARKYVTVSLTGDGGDEIFGGYTQHQLAAKLESFRKIPVSIRSFVFKIINLFKKKSDFTLLGKARELFRWSLTPPENFWFELFEDQKKTNSTFKKWSSDRMRELLQIYPSLTEAVIKYDLFYNTLGDNFLQKVDRTSMAYALECRCPFLDKRVLEYSCRIPTKWKCTPFSQKVLMRYIIKDLVPPEIRKRGKQGFNSPFKEKIKEDYRGKYDVDNHFTFYDTVRQIFLDLWKEKYISK